MTVIDKIRKQAVEETYQDFEKMLFKMCWRAVKMFGGNWEDYLSIANEAFMDAYVTYNIKKGTVFSTWLHWMVRSAILSSRNPSKIDQHTVNTGSDIDLEILPKKQTFDVEEFFNDLSDDAKTIKWFYYS